MNDPLGDKIKAFAKTLGFDDVGIADANEATPFADEVAAAHKAGRFGPLDYLDRTINARLSIKEAYAPAQTVVVVVKNYYTGDHGPDAEDAAKIARYAWGKDYHQWFKKKLRQFHPFLNELAERDVAFWPFNDTGPVLERAWAARAGLGFIGKSAMFIHRGLGTWTLLGGFVTDLVVTPDPPYTGPDCGSCTRCLDACPTNAIIKPHTVDANRCISTWTIERPLHREAFEKAPRNHAWGFGCDICQEVCPWNKFQQITSEERFAPLPGRVYFTPETFTQDLRGSPLHRSSKAGLRANFLRIQQTLQKTNVKLVLGGRSKDSNQP